MYACMWRSEVDIGCLPPTHVLRHIFCWDPEHTNSAKLAGQLAEESLSSVQECWACRQATMPTSQVHGYYMGITWVLHGYYMGTRDLNSGPQAYTASA